MESINGISLWTYICNEDVEFINNKKNISGPGMVLVFAWGPLIVCGQLASQFTDGFNFSKMYSWNYRSLPNNSVDRMTKLKSFFLISAGYTESPKTRSDPPPLTIMWIRQGVGGGGLLVSGTVRLCKGWMQPKTEVLVENLLQAFEKAFEFGEIVHL